MLKVIVIGGPTATGKSRLALSLCQSLQGEVISADSRQVFLYADIGTNKVPLSDTEIKHLERSAGKWVVNEITIHGYDWVQPDEPFTVSHFIEKNVPLIYALAETKKTIFIVGGTGFYIDALVGDSTYSLIPPQPQWRKHWETHTLEELQHKLQKLDPEIVSKLSPDDWANKQRVIRYLELARQAGSVAKATQFSPLKDKLSVLRIGLTAPREQLQVRVQQWIVDALQRGLRDEVHELLERGYRDTKLMQGIVYRPMMDVVDKKISLDQAEKRIAMQLRGYVRRQLVWFRRHTLTNWFDVTEQNFDFKVMDLIESFLEDDN
jgi:tRNA dimethylallyltransferase